ncbi:MAG: 30S ribosomal protein S20 [Oscillospiraceae bacterium]|nr:30S ribosomal protein S20 [Oscillospiraceae bacterium]
MPNIRSAKKRVKIESKRKMHNKILKTNLKTVIKRAKASAVKDGKISVDAFKLAVKKIDQAANKGIIHKNCAARKKSQLAKMSH